MTRLFISLYHKLSGVRPAMYIFLILLTALLVYASTSVKFEEDLSRFFPKESANSGAAELFSRIRLKDKIIILFNKRDSSDVAEQELIDCSERFNSELLAGTARTYVRATHLKTDDSQRQEITNFIYSNLPIFLDRADYQRIDSVITDESIKGSLEKGVASLISPAGFSISPYFSNDPLGIAAPVLSSLKELQSGMEYNIVDGHLFSPDNSTLLYIVDPKYSSNDTKENGRLMDIFDSLKVTIQKEHPSVEIQYMGAPIATIYNARQIKSDTWLTMMIALVIIVTVLWLAFRKVSSIILLLIPAIFGALFSLAIISLVRDSVSAIAIGAGATVMGIALSYSIHIVSHMRHVKSIEQMLEELAYPLSVGSFTTIGAFVGLMFTNSSLLQDFGLFSSLELVGTTLFSLIFLPHMLKINKDEAPNPVINFIERINAFRFEKSKWLLALITVLFVLGLYYSSKVGFQKDMMTLNYKPEVLESAENKYYSEFKSNESRVLLLSSGKNREEAVKGYSRCDSLLTSMKNKGVNLDKSSVSSLLVPMDVQEKRIDEWNRFWSGGKSEKLKKAIYRESLRYGFTDDAFKNFNSLLDKKYKPHDYFAGKDGLPSLLSEWAEISDSSAILITQLFVDGNVKDKVYQELSKNNTAVIVDRAHFAGIWAASVKDDFYFILMLCSFLVFITLLVSYGRFELAVLAFIPMFVSWIIILGLMAIFGVEFNIVNILLSTFIFGIGDDFSIFVLDGLQGEYAKKNKILASHKIAIFFSTFTVIVGMGVLIFAKHPALRSISMISTLGMVAVWFVALTVQPVIFRLFITSNVNKGQPPYTLSGLLLMLFTFSVFVTGCAFATIYISVIIVIPIGGKYKRAIFHKMLYRLSFLPVRLSPTVRIFRENPYNEDFSKPAVIIANHQSFIDILMMLSLTPNVIMMTNGWVWRSPVFGHIVRYAGFLYYKDGVEHHVEEVKKMTDNGYSVVIFPEGTRSADLEIHRFHKGAFYLAEKLSLDILPIIIYGNGNLVSKRQPFYVKQGIIGYRILERILPESNAGSVSDYSDRSRAVALYMRQEYQKLRLKFDIPENSFFYQAVILNYIYKGPVLEWYMRIKVKMENNYKFFHDMIPLDARVTDVGCGYGPLCIMLGLLSDKRVILGIDYDEDKIEIAKNCYSSKDKIRFEHADAMNYDFPVSDVFVINDMLHYLSERDQKKLIGSVVSKLGDGGVVIIRDADSGKKKDHRITKLTEWFSINLLGFNKAAHSPCFVDKGRFEGWAKELNCSFDYVRNDKITSNTIYLLRRKSEQ